MTVAVFFNLLISDSSEVIIQYIPGLHNLALVFIDENNKAVERINMTLHTREELNNFLLEKGFVKQPYSSSEEDKDEEPEDLQQEPNDPPTSSVNEEL